MVWYGIASMVGYSTWYILCGGMVWYSMVLHTRYMVWYDMAWCDVVLYSTVYIVWYGVVLYGMVWGGVWYGRSGRGIKVTNTQSSCSELAVDIQAPLAHAGPPPPATEGCAQTVVAWSEVGFAVYLPINNPQKRKEQPLGSE